MREIVLRAAGAVLLVGAAMLWGLWEIGEGRRRIRELEAAQSLCRFICENIERLSRPLSGIYEAFEDPVLEENGFLPALRKEGFRAALGRARWRLSGGERAILSEFADGLGRGFREEQTALCRYTGDRLGDALETLRRGQKDRERLWRAIPVLFALSLLLLLV